MTEMNKLDDQRVVFNTFEKGILKDWNGLEEHAKSSSIPCLMASQFFLLKGKTFFF